MDKDKNGKVSSAVLNIPLVGPYQCVVLNISQYCVVLNSSQYRQVDKEEFTQWLRSIHL